MQENEGILREEISKTIRKLLQKRVTKIRFRPGKDRIQYAGPIYDHEEIEGMVNAILDGWFGAGKYTRRFENELSRFLGAKKVVMTSSGSSANLLSVSALLSPQLDQDVRVKPEDEVITSALASPATINPILQNNLVPVLLDVEINTYNIDPQNLKTALSSKTKAIVVPHTLGNPNQIDAIADFARDHDLFLIEDACYALGSKYQGRHVGTFGALGTFSFSQAHQITTGEGGAVNTNDEALSNTVLSLREWGRACTISICDPLHCPDKSCPKSISFNKSFAFDSLPEDYDKRYTYINLGYNFQPTEIQAAMGITQLRKLPESMNKRKKNFEILHDEVSKYEDFFILPSSPTGSDPCWYSFPLTIKSSAPFKQKDIIRWFAKHNIEVKRPFAGNILKQPAYKGSNYRIAQKLANTEQIIGNSFALGIYPGITEEKISYIIDVLRRIININKT